MSYNIEVFLLLLYLLYLICHCANLHSTSMQEVTVGVSVLVCNIFYTTVLHSKYTSSISKYLCYQVLGYFKYNKSLLVLQVGILIYQKFKLEKIYAFRDYYCGGLKLASRSDVMQNYYEKMSQRISTFRPPFSFNTKINTIKIYQYVVFIMIVHFQFKTLHDLARHQYLVGCINDFFQLLQIELRSCLKSDHSAYCQIAKVKDCNRIQT